MVISNARVILVIIKKNQLKRICEKRMNERKRERVEKYVRVVCTAFLLMVTTADKFHAEMLRFDQQRTCMNI